MSDRQCFNLLFLIIVFCTFTDCKRIRPLKDQIPGWYAACKTYESGDSLVGKVTFYKNGQSKIHANYISHPKPDVRLVAGVVMIGRWEVKDDALIESIDSVYASPITLKAALEKTIRKGGSFPENRIIEANEHRLILENSKGYKTVLLRIKK